MKYFITLILSVVVAIGGFSNKVVANSNAEDIATAAVILGLSIAAARVSRHHHDDFIDPHNEHVFGPVDGRWHNPQMEYIPAPAFGFWSGPRIHHHHHWRGPRVRHHHHWRGPRVQHHRQWRGSRGNRPHPGHHRRHRR